MIDFVRHASLKHIAVGAWNLPDRFQDVSSPLYAQHVSKDEYAQFNFTDRHILWSCRSEFFDFVHKKVLKCLLRSKTSDFTSVFMTVHESELRVFVFTDVLGVKRTTDIFKPVRETHRTYCNVFRTCMSHKINHISKRSANNPLKKEIPLYQKLWQIFMCCKMLSGSVFDAC